MSDSDFDFVLRHLKKVELIDKKYRPSPEAIFAIQAEIAAANFVLTADAEAWSRLDQKLSSPQTQGNDAMICLVIKGALAALRDKGITKANVKDYVEQCVIAFEEAARAQKMSNRG